MTGRKLFLFFVLILCQQVSAQNDSITKLQELIISDVYLKNNQSQSIQVLNDSIINKNQPSLTNILNYNSVLYFKEYGRGMLSTVSFRGTTASQTAVVWNGININSQLNGSTDFNTINSNDFNSISVKAGGGSVIYGSGAIGGTVHLNNELAFKEQFSNDFKMAYGSFETKGINYRMVFSNEKLSSQIALSYNGSENNYPYVGLHNWKGEQRKNENGQYDVTGLNVSFGYKINSKNSFRVYSQTSNTDRHISLVSESDTKTKYVNGFARNLIEYLGTYNKWTSNAKAAYIFENYQYFGNINSDNFTFGKSECFIGKFDLGYQVTKGLKLNAVSEYNHTKGYGSGFGNNVRQIGSGALMAKWNVNQKWQNEFGIRKEITDNYQSPLLYSAGTSYVFSEFYTLKANASRNFRIPTFNDLYWEEGGNPNLKPESAYQAEIGNVFSYKRIKLSQTMYYNKIKDLLRWVPGDGGIWSPQNTDRVQTYGTEVLLEWAKSYKRHNFVLNGTYAYTISENEDTGKQLFFVPFHKATASVAYSYKKLAANYQFLYNGFVYTRADNDPNEIIDPYNVSNIGIDYDFGFFTSSKLGFQVFNVFNEKYESLEDRPLPGRNFNLYINLKF